MIEYKVKQSRLMIILATVAAGIFEIIFLFFSIASALIAMMISAWSFN